MKIKILLLLSLLALSGCSGMNERTDYKDDAANAPPLDVPPDLVLPQADDHYVIPEGGAQSENYSDYVKGSPTQPPSQASAPKLQDLPSGGKRILIGAPFDRCWLKVEQGLDSAGIAVDDKDRSKGLLYLKGGHNQVTVQAGTEGCEVSANDGSGKSTDETARIIDTLYKKLGN